jgi:hypothetical protein
MAELISVTLTNGATEIINLDYVVRIQAIDESSSAITMTDGAKSVQMAVRGHQRVIASANRLRGAQP